MPSPPKACPLNPEAPNSQSLNVLELGSSRCHSKAWPSQRRRRRHWQIVVVEVEVVAVVVAQEQQEQQEQQQQELYQ